MRGILSGVFQRSLKWAYTSAWTGNDPGSIMPPFREDVILSKLYPITKESIVFTWIIWKKLLQMVQHTQLPLPKAHKIIPEIGRNKFSVCKGSTKTATGNEGV